LIDSPAAAAGAMQVMPINACTSSRWATEDRRSLETAQAANSSRHASISTNFALYPRKPRRQSLKAKRSKEGGTSATQPLVRSYKVWHGGAAASAPTQTYSMHLAV